MHSPEWLPVQDPILAIHSGHDVKLLPMVVGPVTIHKHSMTHKTDCAMVVNDGKANHTCELSGCGYGQHSPPE